MKRRYISVKVGDTYELVEVGPEYIPPTRTNTDAVLWNDRSYQDANDPRFRSRTQHRAYMKQHGVTSTTDYREEWRVKEAKRIEAKQGIDPTRRQDVERAISQLNSRRK